MLPEAWDSCPRILQREQAYLRPKSVVDDRRGEAGRWAGFHLAGKFWPLPRTPAPRPRPCPRRAHLCMTGSVFSPISPYSTESSSFLPLKTSNPAHTLTTPNLCFRPVVPPELCLYSYFPAPRAPEVPGVSGQTHVSSSDRPLTPHFPEASQPSPLAQARN